MLPVVLFLAIGSAAGTAGTAGRQPVAVTETGLQGSGALKAGATAIGSGTTERVPADGTTAESAGKTREDDSELWVEVDQSQQRVFVHQGGKVVQTFVASTGISSSPTSNGTFRIENRGDWFYSPKYKQGGMYWVSFMNRGEFLFHSVPMDENRKIIAHEAAKLGQKASHGCIRLSVADARWFYENIPANTRVVIHD
ncbi:MAG: L,D-transpeptidase [Firmicutes bacterium]|nr:L,D-transpeptidase [Bacillota bacterium]